MLQHCKLELQPGPADPAQQRRRGAGRQAAVGRLQVCGRARGCCVAGVCTCLPALHALFAGPHSGPCADVKRQGQHVTHRDAHHVSCACTTFLRSPRSSHRPPPAPTLRLCSWVHTLWLESNDIGPAVFFPWRNNLCNPLLRRASRSDPAALVRAPTGCSGDCKGAACAH